MSRAGGRTHSLARRACILRDSRQVETCGVSTSHIGAGRLQYGCLAISFWNPPFRWDLTVARFSAPAINATSRLLLAVLVSVSILQTPIPVAHVHSRIGSAGHLSAHLDRHHQRDSVRGDEIHWHLVLPGDSSDDHDSGDDDRPTPSALACAVGSTSSADFGDTEIERLPQLSSHQFAMLSVRFVSEARPSSPRCSLTSAQRTCALLCVIRC